MSECKPLLDGPGPGLLLQGAGTYAVLVGVVAAAAGGWVKWREAQLQGMRTSTSCVLSGESAGERAYVRATEAERCANYACHFIHIHHVICPAGLLT